MTFAFCEPETKCQVTQLTFFNTVTMKSEFNVPGQPVEAAGRATEAKWRGIFSEDPIFNSEDGNTEI